MPRHKFGANAPGPTFFAGVQSISAGISVPRSDTDGYAVIGLQLLCTMYYGETPAWYGTSWPSLPVLEVPDPTLSSCSAPCTPSIEHTTRFNGCAQGVAASRNGQNASAFAEMDASLVLNGQPQIAGALSIDVAVDNDEVVRDVARLRDDSSAALWGEAALAVVEAGGTIKAQTDLYNGSPRSYAFAAATFEYHTKLYAPEMCGIDEGLADSTVRIRLNDGGVAMERWDDP